MTTPGDAPTQELGYAAGTVATGAGLSTHLLYEGLEDTAELRFPMSSVVYDRMRRSDGQVSSVVRAMFGPILQQPRRLVGDDVDPGVMRFCQAQTGIGLPLEARRRRRRQGISYDAHLRDALLSLPFGLMPFEQVYEVAPPAAGFEDTARAPLVAHLRKLAPRMPRTLIELRVARDGGLLGIVQAPPPDRTATAGVFIPTERLVVYVNDKEGADWTGNSVLRAAYKHWLIKDALLRLGPMIVERNGMGVPVITGPPEARARGLAAARSFRAGSEAAMFLETGLSLTLVGVSGTTRDELPLVEYHDRAASRSLLAMFLDLGMTGGLGDAGVSRTFVDQFLMSLRAVIANLEETFTEHVLRDLVELNYGEDEPYPVLKFDPLSSEAPPTADALKALVEAHLLTPDLELEQEVRRRHQLPARAVEDGTEAAPPDDVAASPFATVGLPALVAAGIMSAEEARELLGLPPGAPIPEDAAVPFAELGERVRHRLTILGAAPAAPLVDRLDALRARAAQLAGQ